MPDHGIYEKVDIHGPVPGFTIQHTRPGSEIVKSHWHQELEINTAFEGSSRFFINGRVEDVTPQHVVLEQPGSAFLYPLFSHSRVCCHRHYSSDQLPLPEKLGSQP